MIDFILILDGGRSEARKKEEKLRKGSVEWKSLSEKEFLVIIGEHVDAGNKNNLQQPI